MPAHPAHRVATTPAETPESQERIEWLKEQITELREGAAIKETTGVVAPSLPPAEPGLEEQPPATNSVESE
jgi:hypothetical protein